MIHIHSKARWLIAGALALGGIGLSTRDSSAIQRMVVAITSNNASCTKDPNGNPWVVEADCSNAAFTKGFNVTAVATGAGSTAETLCSDPNTGANQATAEGFVLGSLNTSTGQFATRICQTIDGTFFGDPNAQCHGSPPVTSSCPAGTTLTAIVRGETF